MEKINSKEYWESRFDSGDWDHYDGDQQSVFFANIALDAFPAWLNQELARHMWNVYDIGCAEGGGERNKIHVGGASHDPGRAASGDARRAVTRRGRKKSF